jgi:hypothetical protein
MVAVQSGKIGKIGLNGKQKSVRETDSEWFEIAVSRHGVSLLV